MAAQSKLRDARPFKYIFPLLLVLYVLRRSRSKLASLLPTRQTSLPASYYLDTPLRELAQRDLFTPFADGSRELLVPYKRGVSKVLIRPTKESTFDKHAKVFRAVGEESVKAQRANKGKKKGGVGVDRTFLRQLSAILRIIIPRLHSKETILLLLSSGFLGLRTWLSVLVARLDGRLVGDLVSANGQSFLVGLLYWFLLAIPSCYTNAMIRYLSSKLALSFRTRLTRYADDLYLSSNLSYSKLLTLSSTIESPDQYLTNDIARFCTSLSNLYSNLSKPILDLLIFNFQLFRNVGGRGSAGLFVNYVVTATILRAVTPSFGKLAAVEARLEGEYRGMQSRIVTNAEEIAFYNGAEREKGILKESFDNLVKHIHSIFKIRIAYSMTEDFIIKYMWSAAGYVLIALPVFLEKVVGIPIASASGSSGSASEASEAIVAKRTENYISNRRLLLSLSDAGGRLMYSYKDLAELAGYTERVFTFLETLHRLRAQDFTPPGYSVTATSVGQRRTNEYSLDTVNGMLACEGEDEVSFRNVPVVAPAVLTVEKNVKGDEEKGRRFGEVLVESLSFKVKEGEHLLISGPNGSGKSSIARLLGGLWPIFEGVVKRPVDARSISNGDKTTNKGMFFIPQKPYLSLGSLRDQVIYPDSYPDLVAKGFKDKDLIAILEKVHLEYLVEREGGFDTRKEWKDVLSGGEKQRINLARMFYFRPKFAVLDEATSAVSSDVEGLLYSRAKEIGITLITISHRPSLFKYHNHLLKLVGSDGKWELSAIGTDEEKFEFENEMTELEAKLEQVEGWKERLREIENELALGKSNTI